MHSIIDYFKSLLAFVLFIALLVIYLLFEQPVAPIPPNTALNIFEKTKLLILNTIPSLLATTITFLAFYHFIYKPFLKKDEKVTEQYRPDVIINKLFIETCQFMESFVKGESDSVVIISNSLKWIESPDAIRLLTEIQKKGSQVEIFTNEKLSQSVIEKICNASLFLVEDSIPPKARFTLLNERRFQSAKLAIARGTHPTHEIIIYDAVSGPHILNMACDLVSKARERAKKYVN